MKKTFCFFSLRKIILSLFITSLFLSCNNKGLLKKTELQFGCFAGSAWNVPNPETLAMYDTIISQFERANPNITVNYKSGILRSDYSEWLASVLLNGEEPDIFFILPEDFHLLADMGVLYSLDNYLKTSTSLPGCVFFDTAMQAGKQHDTQYALPIENDPTLLFVNTTLLEKEGIAIPDADWTWDDFFNICEKITKDTDNDGIIDQFGVQGFDWETALYTNRAPLFDNSSRKPKGLFDSSEVYDAFAFLSKLNSLKKDTKVPDFDSGQVAFNISSYSCYRAYGYYPYSIIKNQSFVWQVISLPRGPNGKNAAKLKTLLIGISNRSRNKEAAIAFLDFILTNGGVQTMILEKSKGLPARKDILTRGYVMEILEKDINKTGCEISTDVIFKSIDDAMITQGFRTYQSAVSFVDKEIAEIPPTGEPLRNWLSQLNIKVNNFLLQ